MVAQTNYRYMSDIPAIPGMLADPMAIEAGDILSCSNSGGMAKQTIGTITIGGTYAEGETASIAIVGNSPTSGAFNKTFTATGDAAPTVTEIAAALVAAINADEDVNDILVATNAAGVITLTVRYFGINPVTSVTGSEASSSGTITASPTVTGFATAAEIPFGYAVGQYLGTQTYKECAKITTTSGLTVLGIAKESKSVEAPYPFNPATAIAYPATSTVEIVRRGRIWCPAAAAIVPGTIPAILTATGQLTTNGAGSSTAGTGMLCRSYDAATGLALIEVALS